MQDFSDTTPLELTSENIYPLLDHARRVARAGFARDVAIDERFDPSLPPVLVNRDALLQVVINLLRSEEHTSVLQSLMRISYAVFCLKKNKKTEVIAKTQLTST